MRLDLVVGASIGLALAVPVMAEHILAGSSTSSARDHGSAGASGSRQTQSGRQADPPKWWHHQTREATDERCITGLKERTYSIFYEVHGADSRSAKRSYEQNKPRGRRYDGETMRSAGQTRWRIGYRFCTRPVSAGCEVRSASTNLKITYLMPRWVDYESARSRAQRRWDRFYDRLDYHEKGHGRIARRGAEKLQDELAQFGIRQNCDVLKADVKAAAREILDEIKARQLNYDRRTQHGTRQGIIYPFR